MSNVMTHRDRAACALNCGVPDRIPTFATLTIRENGILAGFGKL
jgi:hypothetical protein